VFARKCCNDCSFASANRHPAAPGASSAGRGGQPPGRPRAGRRAGSRTAAAGTGSAGAIDGPAASADAVVLLGDVLAELKALDGGPATVVARLAHQAIRIPESTTSFFPVGLVPALLLHLADESAPALREIDRIVAGSRESAAT